MRLHRWILSFLLLAAGCVAPLLGAEQTFVLRNYETVRGERYMGAVDFGTFRPTSSTSGPAQYEWVGYGTQPLNSFPGHGEQRLATEFDLGRIPRGTVTRATLRYTLLYERDGGPAFTEVYRIAHFPDEAGPPVGRKDLTAHKQGDEVAVEFDVTEALRAAGSHAAFEVGVSYDRYFCRVYCGGRQGPVAKEPHRAVLTPEQRPALTITVDAPADLPPILATACADLGEVTRIGPAADMAYRLVEKPAASTLADRDLAAGTLRPDVEGRFVIEGVRAGVRQYATIESRRVLPRHPRLWLTPQTLEKLRGMRSIGHPLWIGLLRKTDDLLHNGVQAAREESGGFEAQRNIESLSLAYAVTGDKDYAAPCKEIMEWLVAGSLPMVSRDSGFFLRSFGRALPEGFDRIYPELTAEEKWRYVDEMNYWLAWFAQEGYQGQGAPMGNYFSAYFAALNMAAYATYEDNPRAYILLDRARVIFDRFIIRQAANGVLRGGDEPEGRYADLYFDSWFRYLIARSTAGGEGPIPGFTWPQEVVYSQIHRLRPDRRTVYDGGQWRDTDPSWPSKSTMSLLSAVLAGRKEGEYAERFANEQYDLSPNSFTFENLVTFDPDRPERSWDSEPLSYFSRGLDLATMRSSWGQDAVWASFQNAGPHVADGQHWDFGHWEIYRGGDPLVVNPLPSDEGYTTDFVNCLLIDSGKEINPYSPRQASGGGISQAYEETGAYVYLAGDFAPHYTWGDKSVAKTLERQFLYIRPNLFVLYDRFQPSDEKYNAFNRIHFAAPPQVDGTTITCSKGTSQVWARAFGSSPVVITRPDGQYQANAVDLAIPSGAGPRRMIVALAALAGGETPPQVSCDMQGADVKVRFSGPTSVEVTLHSDGSPGGALTLDGKTHSLATDIRTPVIEP